MLLSGVSFFTLLTHSLQIIKKITGTAGKTAAYLTNVGNEHGQILNSVVTAGEGAGLELLAQGIVQRYQAANVEPPAVIYVDRDCCVTSGNTPKLLQHFHPWKCTLVLDVFHFIARFGAGVTSNSHPLYTVFVQHLSGCIFEWNKADVENLRGAKAAELEAEGRLNVTPAALDRAISKKELVLHCRRDVRPPEAIEAAIQKLLESLDGEKGTDSLGVPLFQPEKMWAIWEDNRRHLHCIQDPPGVQLYTITGTLKKGGVPLQVLRSGRGTTSLESFHLHVNKFIPG